MKQEHDALRPPKDWVDSFQGILDYFTWCGFADSIGNPIALNVEFRQIAVELINLRQSAKSTSPDNQKYAY